MKLDLMLEINRTLGRRDDKPMSVRITDNISGCRILEVNFSLSDFMEILTGRSGLSSEGEFYNHFPFGCKGEHKEEIVTRPKGYGHDPDMKEVRKIVGPLEVDGWRARTDDLFNHHRWVGDAKKVRVTFYRWVKPDGTPWEPKDA